MPDLSKTEHVALEILKALIVHEPPPGDEIVPAVNEAWEGAVEFARLAIRDQKEYGQSPGVQALADVQATEKLAQEQYDRFTDACELAAQYVKRSEIQPGNAAWNIAKALGVV